MATGDEDDYAVHFVLALFRQSRSSQVRLASVLQCISTAEDSPLLARFPSVSLPEVQHFLQTSHSHLFHVHNDFVYLQPQPLVDLIQLISESLGKGGRNSEEIYRLYQHSRRISDSARRLIGPSKADLTAFLQLHPAIFSVGFNGADVQLRRILTPIRPDHVEAIQLPLERDAESNDEDLENDLDSDSEAQVKGVDAATQTSFDLFRLYSLLADWLAIRTDQS